MADSWKDKRKPWAVTKEGRMLLALVCEAYPEWSGLLDKAGGRKMSDTVQYLATHPSERVVHYFTVEGWRETFSKSKSWYKKLSKHYDMSTILQHLERKGYFDKALVPWCKRKYYYIPKLTVFRDMYTMSRSYSEYIGHKSLNSKFKQCWGVDFNRPLARADNFHFSWEKKLGRKADTKKLPSLAKQVKLWEEGEAYGANSPQREEKFIDISTKKPSKGVGYTIDERRWAEEEQIIERTLDKLTGWFLRLGKGLESKDVQPTPKEEYVEVGKLGGETIYKRVGGD